MSIFDEVIARRNTRSEKWDRMEKVYNVENVSSILPMWVADMDFAAPKEVIDAMQQRLQHPVFGYSFVCNRCIDAIIHWYESRYNWSIHPETILFHHGVVPAIATIIETFTKPGDKIVISTPIYPPFFNVPKKMAREIVTCPLNEQHGFYSYDFEALEQTFKQGVALYILCNPHNPGGKVWSKNDLEKLIELCIQYDVILLSDEIHGDLTFETRYTPVFSIARSKDAKVISCIAPTKTFNLAGVQAAMMVAENKQLFTQLQATMEAHGNGELNAFASAAVEAAYTYGEQWLNELITYISRNMDYVIKELTTIKGIHINKPDGTYLLWIDYRETGLDEKVVMQKLLNVGELALEPGTKYHEMGRGFLRMNVACPFTTVQDGVARFKKAFNA